MGVRTGAAAQAMIATETTYGTYEVPTRSYEFVSETMKLRVERIDSKGLRGGRRIIGKFAAGKRSAAGDVDFEFSAAGMGLLLQHCLGSDVITGASPVYTHTCTAADLPTSFTLQIGKPDISGTVDPFTYLGCRVTAWEMSLKAGEFLMIKPTIVAQDETTSQTLAAFTDPAVELLSYVGATLTAGGTQVDISDFTFKGDNKLDATRFRLRGAATPKEPFENAFRQYTGTATADFESLTQYNHYVAADELTLAASFQGAPIPGGAGQNFGVTITANVRYNPDMTPVVPGPTLLTQPMGFEVISSGASDAAALTVVITNSDAAA
jgi:hypothetical protein